jgi:hypothetical protein
MNRLEQLSFEELFKESKNRKYKNIESISFRRKEILESLKTAIDFESIKLNCELLALLYLENNLKL